MKHELIRLTKQENPDTGNGLTYPENDDIYTKAKEEQNIDPENITALKEPKEKEELNNQKDFCG